jgi:hypothetical protein
METYVQEVRKLENKFSGLEVLHVLREHNVTADALSKLGSTRAQVPAGVFVQRVEATIHQPFTTGLHRHWLCMARTGGYAGWRGLERTLYRLHPRSRITGKGGSQERCCRPRHATEQGVCPSRRQTLSARRTIWSAHEVRHNRRRLGYFARDTRGSMR